MKLHAAAALLALAAGACDAGGPAPEPTEARTSAGAAAKPELALLTSLPIAFGEGFGLDAPAHPVMARLEGDYTVRPVDGPAELKEGGLLLAIQPRALPAERLVALDAWVRRGGRALLLADPMLEWESKRPLGDVLRPPPAFPDTGLLARWGLTLYAPDQAGPRMGTIAGHAVMTASPGVLAPTSAECRIGEQGLIARCKVGKGAALVVADADFLNVAGPGSIDGPTAGNLPALTAALASL